MGVHKCLRLHVRSRQIEVTRPRVKEFLRFIQCLNGICGSSLKEKAFGVDHFGADTGRRNSPEAVPRRTGRTRERNRTDHHFAYRCRCRNAVIQSIRISRAPVWQSPGFSQRLVVSACLGTRDSPEYSAKTTRRRQCASASETEPRSHAGNQNHSRNLPRSQSRNVGVMSP